MFHRRETASGVNTPVLRPLTPLAVPLLVKPCYAQNFWIGALAALSQNCFYVAGPGAGT